MKKSATESEAESKNLNSVSTILTLSLADLRRKNQHVEPILNILAYLSPDDISINVLKECWNYCQKREILADSQLTDFENFSLGNTTFQEGLKELLHFENNHEGRISVVQIEEFYEALEFLLSYFIISADLNQTRLTDKGNMSQTGINDMKISISHLTQQVIRLNHSKSGKYERYYQNVFDWVVENLEYDEKDLNDVRRVGLLVPHALQLESLQNTISSCNIVDLLQKIGRHQLYLFIKERNYGKDHPETAITLVNLGNAWGSCGDYRQKKDLLSRALEIFEKHYGKGHPETAITLDNLGNVLGSLGNYEKQKDLLTRALEIKEKHYGKDHPSTGITLTNLGIAWGSLGDYVKQKDLLTRALEIQERHYGKDHPQLGIALTNLGIAWGSLGDHEKKKELLTRALEIFENVYGKDHPRTKTVLANLGNSSRSIIDY